MRVIPKITIITAVKNNRSGLLATLQSLQQQTYPHLEYVVIDGGSTDGTVELIQAYVGKGIDAWVSEQDKGISDAFNKGLDLSTGDYINFQGAGDTFYQPDSIIKLFDQIKSEVLPELVCGQVMRTDEAGQPLWVAPKKISQPFDKRSLLWKLTLPHQGLFTHRRFFARWGAFDLSVKYAMDYEILLRAYHDFPSTVILPVIISNWQAGGIGTHRIKSVLREYHQLKTRHRVANQIMLASIHRFNLLKLFIKTKLLAKEA